MEVAKELNSSQFAPQPNLVSENRTSSEAPRFTSLEEVKPTEPPIRVIPSKWWTPNRAKDVWDRMCLYSWMLSDVSKGEAEFVFRETLLGKIHWFEIGGGLGLAHVYGIEAGVGTINIEIFGDKREFAKTYGMGREPLRVALQAIMEWCQVRKLRAFIAAPNVKSRRMARRMGFEEEGLLKQEWLVRNNPTDVWVYGYLGGK